MSRTGRKCQSIKLRVMTSRSNNTPRGASKSKNTAPSAARPLPNWGWLLAGLVIGLFIAFLAGLAPSATDVRTVADRIASADQQTDQVSGGEPVFDFYTLLPESEVTVTIAPPEERAPTAPVSSRPGPKNTAPINEARQYLLQAGSFRSFKDAERLRAKLLLEGYTPKVEKVTVGGGETWHRVQLGPFSDRSTIDNVQQELAEQNVDTLLLQLK